MEKEVNKTTVNKTTNKRVSTTKRPVSGTTKNKVTKKTIENNAEKFDIGMENKSFIDGTKELFNKHMKVSAIILFVIAAVLFSLSFYSSVTGDIIIAETAVPKGFFEQAGYLALLDAVIMIAGLTPYCFLSVIGMLEALAVVGDMQIRRFFNLSTLPTLYIGGLIQMVGLSMIIASGIYFCILSTKKNRYYSQSNFGMKDIKRQFYEVKKDEKKLEELNKKEEEKEKKRQELNVKVPYLKFGLIYVVTLIIQIVGLIITKI